MRFADFGQVRSQSSRQHLRGGGELRYPKLAHAELIGRLWRFVQVALWLQLVSRGKYRWRQS
jgi:hypothetical protein